MEMIWAYCIFGLLFVQTISCSQEIASENSVRMRRSAKVEKFGQDIILNPDDPEVLNLAEKSLKKYERDVSSSVHYAVVRVYEATQQLVAGYLYKLTFEASPLLCHSKSSSKCSSSTSPLASINCHSELWSQPWLKKTTIKVDCFKPFTKSKNLYY